MASAILVAFLGVLAWVVLAAPEASQFGHKPEALIQPVVALVGLTALVWCLMVLWRNLAVVRGKVSPRYFRSYASDAPAEWVERPARAYMNLLELPVLFYVACALMLATGRFDGVQVALAWVFVLARCVHALVHIGFNYVPLRFTAFLAGSVTLAVLWARFAAQICDGEKYGSPRRPHHGAARHRRNRAGLGMGFMLEEIKMMSSAWLVAAIGLAGTPHQAGFMVT